MTRDSVFHLFSSWRRSWSWTRESTMIWIITWFYLLQIEMIQITDCFLNDWSILINTSQRRKKRHTDCWSWMNTNLIIHANLLNIAIRLKSFYLICQLIRFIFCSLEMWWIFNLWNINTLRSSRRQWFTKMKRLSKWNFWVHSIHSESKLSKNSSYYLRDEQLSCFRMIRLWFWSSCQRQQLSHLLLFIRIMILTTCLTFSKNRFSWVLLNMK
jgi:hypothetical protein